ncbi:MAG: DUF4221 family protein [Oceanospirillaceae bacterium]|nr:DUF4221 family protein [Oceanospirillaceae bacterium]
MKTSNFHKKNYSNKKKYSSLDKIVYVVVVYCFFYSITSCSDNLKNTETSFLELTGEIQIPIDTRTSGISEFATTYLHKTSSDSIFINQQNYLCYLNRWREIQFYDLKSKNLVHQISFVSDGPNAILGNITSFNIKSLDSIYVSSFPLPFIYRVNLLGEILERIELGSFNKPIEPVSSTSRPVVLYNDHIYTGFYTTLPPTDFHSPLSTEELDGVILNIDLKSKKQELQYYLPTAYTKNNLFSRYYYNPSIGINKFNNQILISFGASDSITVTDFNNFERNYYAGSSLFDEVASLKSKQDAWDHYRLNYMYEGIVYDSYRECYYRFLTLPKKEDELKSGDLKTGRIKDISIIILDNNFQQIGETLIDPSYSNLVYFIDERGLNLYNIKKGLSDEDNLYFGIFNLSSF